MTDNATTQKPKKPLVPENRQKLVYSAATFIIGLALGGSVLYTTHSKPAFGKATDTASIQNALARITHGQVKLVGTFPAGRGYTGLEIQASGMEHPAVAWALPDNDGILFGDLFDLAGNNLNVKAAMDHGLMPKQPENASAQVMKDGKLPPPPPIVQGLSASMAASGFVGITEGAGPVHLDVFFDPNCIFCHRQWLEFKNDPNWEQKFTINWIPVGFLKPSSSGKAAAILAGGLNALSENEQGFDDNAEIGGIAPSTNQTALSEVQHNTSAWTALLTKYKNGQIATPSIVINNDYIIESELPHQDLSVIYRQLTEYAQKTPQDKAGVPPAPAVAPTSPAPQPELKTSPEPQSPSSPVVGPK